MITRRRALAGAGLVAPGLGMGSGLLGAGLGGLILGGGAARAAEPAPAAAYRPEDFFRPRTTSDAALSPSGGRVAVLHADRTDKVLTSYMDIIDVAHPDQPPKRIALGNHEADAVAWANEKRLLIWVTYNVAPKGMPDEYIRRVISVGEDGTQAVPLFVNRGKAIFYIHDLGTLIDPLPDDPDHVLMMAFDMSRYMPTLYQVDVNTGAAVVVEYGAARTTYWFTQKGVPMLRTDTNSSGSVLKILARGPGETNWKPVRTLKIDQTRDFEIIGAAAELGVFYVRAVLEGEDRPSLRELNVRSLEYGPPLLPHQDADAVGAWIDPSGKLRGVRYMVDKPVYEFADKALAPHFAAIEKHFGPECGVDLVDMDKAESRYVGRASGPRQPGLMFLYDKAAHSITEFGEVRANLRPERLGAMEVLKVRTRDGQAITAYLTAPASGAPGPLVVMPHGGPRARDFFAFNAWVQTLAAQGWWVLQPNFRGSGGYGLAFAKAGFGRWGDRMQEDVEDAVAQVLADKKLNAGQVAIMGASYGGYAALMGAIRRPELYRAVICIAGVSDLPEMLAYDEEHDDTPDKFLTTWWRDQIGDPVRDADKLAAASPRRRAAEFKAPVLIIHGAADGIVPVGQGRGMAEALKAAGKPCDYWEVKKVGHPEWPESQQVELMTRCVTFLGKALA
jgi:dipeptidyl aminopeptidase/acylaminoacyl peptidase